jgi:DNA-binding GntR family transcriptional regulator
MQQIATEPMMSTRALSEIRAAILNGSLAPGSRIRQEDLAAKLGVSREPIRHALVLLEREGLIKSVPNHGVVIAPVHPQLINDVYEFRETVDCAKSSFAASAPRVEG